MRQIQIQKPGGLENLKLENVDSPNLANDEVLMKIHASSLNYHDLMVALGLIPTDDKRVPLSDGAGEILEVGSDVTRWKIGDKVMSVCFPNWVNGPPKYELLSFIGDNEDGYAAASLLKRLRSQKYQTTFPFPKQQLCLAQDLPLGEHWWMKEI